MFGLTLIGLLLFAILVVNLVGLIFLYGHITDVQNNLIGSRSTIESDVRNTSNRFESFCRLYETETKNWEHFRMRTMDANTGMEIKKWMNDSGKNLNILSKTLERIYQNQTNIIEVNFDIERKLSEMYTLHQGLSSTVSKIYNSSN